MIPDGGDLTAEFESRRAGEVINGFLAGLSKSERRVFMMRYWIDAGIAQIASQTGFSHSKIKSMLARLRKRLSEELRKEGIFCEYSNRKQ
jgi:RNA polymerase sigma-70 factor (ECF subfamily)